MSHKLIEETTLTSASDTTFSATLTPDADGVYYIAVHAISDADQYYLYLKKFSVKEVIAYAQTVTFARDGNTLSMSTTTPNASIYYTLDGSTPTTSSTKYTGPITLTQNCTVKAIATAEGMENSSVTTYNVNWFKVESVNITFENKQVHLSTTTPDARIYYTLDGSTPTESSNLYTGPFSVSQNCTVTARAFKDFFNPSDMTSLYIDLGAYTCSAPTFNRDANVLTINSATENATIYYTLDGSTPTTASTKYAGPITLAQNCTVKAMATAEGYEDSEVTTYNVGWFKVESVVITYENKLVHLTTTTPDARIYYTLDGSTPTALSNKYTEPFSVSQNCTVTARAFKENLNPSDMTSLYIDLGAYTCSAPTFNRDANVLTINSATENATIYYTLDGSTPTTASTKYAGPITLAQNCTVKAMATAEGYEDSEVTTYNVGWFKVESVVITYENKLVHLTTTTPDARIYYTLDGSTPTALSNKYTEPFSVSQNCTVTARAFKENLNPSDMTSLFIDLDNIRCSAPAFQQSGMDLVITSQTEGAIIYYTLDGSEPTAQSNRYTGPVTLTQNCLVKAFAASTSEDMLDSQVATYTVTWFTVENVAIDFVNLRVQMSTPTPNARIYYTLDGSEPTANSTLYAEPFSISQNCTVKAIGQKENFNPSEVTSLDIDLDNVKCDEPTFRQTGTELAISVLTEGATIYYTLDGSEPNAKSSRYDGPIQLTRNCLVKAIAMKDGYLPSVVGSYAVNYFQVQVPSFAVANGVMTITCGTEGAAIYYKIGEGTLDIVEENRYTGPITLTDNSIVRAVGVKDGYRNSEEGSYNPNSFSCSDVTIAYNGRYVQMTTPTDGAAIYYTTDGSNPTTASQQYSGSGVPIGTLCSINAIAVKQNMNNSKVSSKEISYLYDGQTATVRNTGQLYSAFEWNQGKVESRILVVKGPLNAADMDFIKNQQTVEHLDLRETVIETLADKAFAGMNIVSVELPAGLTQVGSGLFEGCNRLAAIVWNSNVVLPDAALTGVDNPNLLVYVNALSLTTRTVNVVSMAMNRASNLVLQDVAEGNGNFYCPRQFRADRASYTRNFQLQSGMQAIAGWETITLPFNVATVTHEHNGLLAPFGSNVAEAKPFWLYSLLSAGFNPAMEIAANTPYIISMPNHPDYADEYNQNGNVTFAATNIEIPVTQTIVTSQETPKHASLVPATCAVEKAANIYAINKEIYNNRAPGSLFVPGLRDVRPFEAYITLDANSTYAPLFIPIFDQIANTIQAIPLKDGNTEIVRGYNLSGLLVASGMRSAVMKSLTKGVYIINGRKVVIK